MKVDRISKLPDNLIHDILSFIDMRYAVQTCVLSKRWKDTWKSLPFIRSTWGRFPGAINMSGAHNRFINFMDKLFQLRDDSDIQRMIMLGLFIDDNTSTEALNRWIVAAVTHNVQQLDLTGFYFRAAFEIPRQLLNCKSLKGLGIMFPGHTDIVLPESMSLLQMNKLFLGLISISNSDLQRLFSSCPVIETVSLLECNLQMNNQRNILIDSHSLHSLRLTDIRYTHSADESVTCTTEISAPNVKEFRFTGFMTDDYSLENLSSIVSAYFRMRLIEREGDENADTYAELPAEEKQMFAKRTMKFLGAVQQVHHLELSSGFLEVLLQAPGTLYRQPPQLCNLETMRLEMRFTRGSLDSIAYLLQISPIIKSLIVVSQESNLPDVGADWEVGFSSMCMFSHLKSVEIRGAEGCENELMFLRCLLKNSMVLQKVTLIFKSGSDSLDEGRQKRLFKRNLTTLLKAYPNVRVKHGNNFFGSKFSSLPA